MAAALQPTASWSSAAWPWVTLRLARYTTNGTLGYQLRRQRSGPTPPSAPPRHDHLHGHPLSDGKIVAGGYGAVHHRLRLRCGRASTRTARWTTASTATAASTVPTWAVTDQANAMVLLPDGRFTCWPDHDGNVAMVRYNPNGSRDSSFGNAGIATVDLGSGTDTANAILRPQ
jgi:hypothetical protein